MPLNDTISWLVIALALMIAGCGSVADEHLVTVSGQVSFGDLDPETLGPVFVAVLNENPMAVGTSLADALVDIQSIDKGRGGFYFQLSGKVVAPGDSVYIIAFADNDFVNGVPEPGPGDVIGFYLEDRSLSPAYVLASGENTGIDIVMNKQVFDYQASLSGEVRGADRGAVTVFAYAGAIDSLDFSLIDPYQVVGYTRVEKNDAAADFALSLLPYGYSVPIENVYLLAFLDANGNGVPDSGDRLGFLADDRGLPALLTVYPEHRDQLVVDLTLTLPEPSGFALSMEGRVAVASGLDVGDLPLFVLVVRAGDNLDRSALAQGRLDDVVFFTKLAPGLRDFACDLSNSGLAPGEAVMVLAVCDRDYAAGFPDIGSGDYLGYYQDRATMAVDYQLAEGINRVASEGDRDFHVNRMVYDHEAAIQFELDDSNLNNLNPAVRLDPGEHVTVVAVQADGVTIGGDPQIDMDYIVGFGSLTVPGSGNEGQVYTLELLPALDHRIPVETPFAVSEVYVFAIFDGNTDGQDQNNYLGYYWEPFMLFFMAPGVIDRIENGITLLDRTVRFTTGTL